MARILFRLRMVPEDEADDLRQMLIDSSIPWFETSAGRWGVSFPALWVRDDADLPRAKELLADYQERRVQRIRAARDSDPAGEPETVLSRFQTRPIQGLAIVAIVTAIMYFSIRPFFYLLGS